MKEHLTLSEASEALGVSKSTIRRWDRQGTIHADRTPGGHRRIPRAEIKRLLGIKEDNPTVALCYCRCSTAKQKNNLERQVGRVLEAAAKRCFQSELYKEIASGLNDHRRQFHNLIERIGDPDVRCVIAEYQDRLTRFGFHTFEKYCKAQHVEVIVLEEEGSEPFEEEMTQDLISIISSYSGRLYERRGGKSNA